MKTTMQTIRKKFPLLLAVLMICLLLPVGSAQAAKYPKSIQLSQKRITLMTGKSKKLKAQIAPSKVTNKTVTWKSSNPDIVKVSASGKIKAVSPGKAKITATTENGKKASCTVESVCYEVKGNKIHVWTPEGTRIYHRYYQKAYGGRDYYESYGCVLTTVSIVSSGFGKNYTPKQIHTGSASAKHTERYALKKMKQSGRIGLSNVAAISVRTASQILKDMGIKNKPVYTYEKEQAEQEITKHLKSGKPVIAKATNKKHNGIRLANGHHAIILVGIDNKGYVTFIDPTDARINYAHGSNNTCKITLKDLLEYHMEPASGNYKMPYVTSLSTAGGYILVG